MGFYGLRFCMYSTVIAFSHAGGPVHFNLFLVLSMAYFGLYGFVIYDSTYDVDMTPSFFTLLLYVAAHLRKLVIGEIGPTNWVFRFKMVMQPLFLLEVLMGVCRLFVGHSLWRYPV